MITCHCEHVPNGPSKTTICSAEKTCQTDSYCVYMTTFSLHPHFFCSLHRDIGCDNEMNKPLHTKTLKHGGVIQQCCNTSDLCNKNLLPYPSYSASLISEADASSNIPVFAMVSGMLGLLALVCCFVLIFSKRKRINILKSFLGPPLTEGHPEADISVFATLVSSDTKRVKEKNQVREQSTSGSVGESHDPLLSSSRLPETSNSKIPGVYLSLRTISSDVQLVDVIGTGRYGQVYLGYFCGSKVAVKKLPVREESSWANERAIYSHLRHHAILQFVASDRVANQLATELWLVVDYHQNGSLLDFLSSSTACGSKAGAFPSELAALQCMSSIAAGLAYLHQDIRGTPPDYKPAIAHCDLKSRNILVKEDLTCCIADFGLAVTPDSFAPNAPGVEARKRRYIIGTRRYTSPDLLHLEMSSCDCLGCNPAREDASSQHHEEFCLSDERGNGNKHVVSFEQCRQADVYSVALVFWEICRRVKPWGLETAELPFFEHFPNGEPSVKEIHEVVYEKRIRPKFKESCPSHMSSNPNENEQLETGSGDIFLKVQQIVDDCWIGNASARIPSLLVKKKLDKLCEKLVLMRKQSERGYPDMREKRMGQRFVTDNQKTGLQKCPDRDLNSNFEIAADVQLYKDRFGGAELKESCA